MVLDPAAAARVEAAFDAAQLKTRAPLVCVLAGASASRDAEFLLGACILALATPLPLLAVHRAFRPPHLCRSAAGRHSGRGPGSRCRRCAAGSSRSAARARPAIARRWRNLSCAGSTARSAARSSMCRSPSITSASFRPRTPRASSPRTQWQAAVDEALGPLAAGATEAALTGLAAALRRPSRRAIPAGRAGGPARQRFHIV